MSGDLLQMRPQEWDEQEEACNKLTYGYDGESHNDNKNIDSNFLLFLVSSIEHRLGRSICRSNVVLIDVNRSFVKLEWSNGGTNTLTWTNLTVPK